MIRKKEQTMHSKFVKHLIFPLHEKILCRDTYKFLERLQKEQYLDMPVTVGLSSLPAMCGMTRCHPALQLHYKEWNAKYRDLKLCMK
jgi:hypothetical protein